MLTRGVTFGIMAIALAFPLALVFAPVALLVLERARRSGPLVLGSLFGLSVFGSLVFGSSVFSLLAVGSAACSSGLLVFGLLASKSLSLFGAGLVVCGTPLSLLASPLPSPAPTAFAPNHESILPEIPMATMAVTMAMLTVMSERSHNKKPSTAMSQ